jgi:hypothetical protein
VRESEQLGAWRLFYWPGGYSSASLCRDTASIQAAFVVEKMAMSEVFFDTILRYIHLPPTLNEHRD